MAETVVETREWIADGPEAGRGLLLVVDDEAGPRESLRLLFSGEFQVELARGGVEGLGKATSAPVDVVVLDLRMPDLDGMSVLRAIKEHDPSIEVVVLTGYETPAAVEEARRLGARACVSKPFDVQTIRDRVREAFARRRRAAGAGRSATIVTLSASGGADELSRACALARAAERRAGAGAEPDNPLSIVAERLRLVAAELQELMSRAGAERPAPPAVRVVRELDLCERLARRFLTLSSAPARVPAVVEVGELLDDLGELMGLHAAARRRAVETIAIPHRGPMLAAVPAVGLMQVLTHLCLRALRAVPEGAGRVTLTAEGAVRGTEEPPLPGGWAAVRLRAARFDRHGAYVRVGVFRNGPGLNRQQLREAVDSASAGSGADVGVGLESPSCRRFIDEFGGQLVVASHASGGLRLWLDMPQAAASAD